MEIILNFFLAILHKVASIIDKYRLQLYWKNGVRQLTNNKKKLSVDQIKQIKKFYAPYFKVDCSTHAYLYEKTGRFAVNYIPYYIHYTIIDPFFNDWEWAAQNSNKCFQRKLFGLEKSEMPATIVYRCNDIWYDSDDNIISKKEAISLICEEIDIFIKPATDSCGGKGIVNINLGLINQCEKNDCPKIIDETIKSFPKDIIIQRTLKQSSIISQINPSSVNTIRCMTLLMKSGEVKIVSCILRVGANGSVVDNLHSGGFCVGIEESGKLSKYGYTIDGKTVVCHPDTGVIFEGLQIPSFAEMVLLVSKAHRHVPKCRLISWDIAFDETNKPLLIEGNLCSGGIGVHQLAKGPIFGENTSTILEEVFGKAKFKTET